MPPRKFKESGYNQMSVYVNLPWETREIRRLIADSEGHYVETDTWNWINEIPSQEQASNLVVRAKELGLKVCGPFGNGPWVVGIN